MWASTAIFYSVSHRKLSITGNGAGVWRDLFVASAIGIVFLLFRQNFFHIDKKHISFIILYGFVLALFNSSWTLSVALNGAAVSTVFSIQFCAYTAILGWRYLVNRSAPQKSSPSAWACWGVFLFPAPTIHRFGNLTPGHRYRHSFRLFFAATA
jgi:glucose uptake protein GlcU